jgi:hypothetical protein
MIVKAVPQGLTSDPPTSAILRSRKWSEPVGSQASGL